MKLLKNKNLITSIVACLLLVVTTGYFMGTEFIKSKQQINI